MVTTKHPPEYDAAIEQMREYLRQQTLAVLVLTGKTQDDLNQASRSDECKVYHDGKEFVFKRWRPNDEWFFVNLRYREPYIPSTTPKIP